MHRAGARSVMLHTCDQFWHFLCSKMRWSTCKPCIAVHLAAEIASYTQAQLNSMPPDDAVQGHAISCACCNEAEQWAPAVPSQCALQVHEPQVLLRFHMVSYRGMRHKYACPMLLCRHRDGNVKSPPHKTILDPYSRALLNHATHRQHNVLSM
jgi:hypothetical protein